MFGIVTEIPKHGFVLGDFSCFKVALLSVQRIIQQQIFVTSVYRFPHELLQLLGCAGCLPETDFTNQLIRTANPETHQTVRPCTDFTVGHQFAIHIYVIFLTVVHESYHVPGVGLRCKDIRRHVNLRTTSLKLKLVGTDSHVTEARIDFIECTGPRHEFGTTDGTVVATPYVDQLTGTDAVSLKVYATIDGKISGNALATTAYDVYGSVSDLPTTGTLPVQEDAVEVTIVYSADPSVTTTYRYYGVDYAKTLAVTLKSSTDVAQGASVSTVIEKVEVEYASGEKEAVTDYDLSLSTVSADQKTGKITVYAYLENAGKNGATLIDAFEINVTKAE